MTGACQAVKEERLSKRRHDERTEAIMAGAKAVAESGCLNKLAPIVVQAL